MDISVDNYILFLPSVKLEIVSVLICNLLKHRNNIHISQV